MKAPSVSSSSPPPGQSVRVAGSTIKLAKSYYGDSGNNTNMKPGNLSSILEKLYAWEKKLYKEVKVMMNFMYSRLLGRTCYL